jgi:hypothetical protein
MRIRLTAAEQNALDIRKLRVLRDQVSDCERARIGSRETFDALFETVAQVVGEIDPTIDPATLTAETDIIAVYEGGIPVGVSVKGKIIEGLTYSQFANLDISMLAHQRHATARHLKNGLQRQRELDEHKGKVMQGLRDLGHALPADADGVVTWEMDTQQVGVRVTTPASPEMQPPHDIGQPARPGGPRIHGGA